MDDASGAEIKAVVERRVCAGECGFLWPAQSEHFDPVQVNFGGARKFLDFIRIVSGEMKAQSFYPPRLALHRADDLINGAGVRVRRSGRFQAGQDDRILKFLVALDSNGIEL